MYIGTWTYHYILILLYTCSHKTIPMIYLGIDGFKNTKIIYQIFENETLPNNEALRTAHILLDDGHAVRQCN